MPSCPKPTKQKKKKARGISDGNLQSLWRKVVRAECENKCVFCGRSPETMECHHINKRNMFLLKHDFRNGVLVCKYPHEGQAMSCHAYATTPMGQHNVGQFLAQKGYLQHLDERSGSSKQYFVNHNITRTEFLLSVYNELQNKLKELREG
jgi:hypothetical protein